MAGQRRLSIYRNLCRRQLRLGRDIDLFDFNGVQVVVGGKIDGSQVGADVYLDGEKIDHINSNSSSQGGKNGYYEVWRSNLLDEGEHTIRLVPTGKFSVDYFGYVAESPWMKVDGEDSAVEKEGTWALWESSDAYNGTETYVGDDDYDWRDTSLSYTFNGIQVCVGAKMDGSQEGAKSTSTTSWLPLSVPKPPIRPKRVTSACGSPPSWKKASTPSAWNRSENLVLTTLNSSSPASKTWRSNRHPTDRAAEPDRPRKGPLFRSLYGRKLEGYAGSPGRGGNRAGYFARPG